MLEGFDYFNLNALQLRAMNQEYKIKNSKDAYKTHHPNTHVVECDSDALDDENSEVYTAEFVWPSQSNLVLVHHLSRLKRVGRKK